MSPIELLEPRMLLTAGALDRTFGNGGIVTTDLPGPTHVYASALAMQKDGKIVIAGNAVGAGNDIVITRLNPAGTPDPSFGAGGVVTVDFTSEYATARNVVIDAAGRILVSGTVQFELSVVRLHPDGRIDTSFGTGGKISFSGNYSGDAAPLAIQPDGKILIAAIGNADDAGLNVFRLDDRGRLDPSFASGGRLHDKFGDANSLGALAALPDGRFVLAGQTSPAGDQFTFVVRYTAAGKRDSTFAKTGLIVGNFFPVQSVINDIALSPEGKVLISARISDGYAVARFRADGAFDLTFGQRGIATIPVPGPEYLPSHIAVDGSGNIALVGRKATDNVTAPGTLALARLTAAGALDTSFDTDGIALLPLSLDASGSAAAFDVAFQADGKLVVAAPGDQSLLAARFTTSGALDPAFGRSGQATLAVPGHSNQSANAVAALPDGRILAAGSTGYAGLFDLTSATTGLLVRYQANGSLDPTFGNAGRVVSNLFPGNHEFLSVVILPTGKFLVGGSNGSGGFVARFNSNGTLDTTFGAGGKVITDSAVARMLLLKDGKLLVG
ncbi:MAG: Delta-60 repeat-containing protein, partial [Phycisphaerales bacterium]|nr:Delta-60 repeat-containing protein [Phycisphaerales bacterium]